MSDSEIDPIDRPFRPSADASTSHRQKPSNVPNPQIIRHLQGPPRGQPSFLSLPRLESFLPDNLVSCPISRSQALTSITSCSVIPSDAGSILSVSGHQQNISGASYRTRRLRTSRVSIRQVIQELRLRRLLLVPHWRTFTRSTILFTEDVITSLDRTGTLAQDRTSSHRHHLKPDR